MLEKMLVLIDIIDGLVIVKGVCALNRRELAEEWSQVDKHRQVIETEILS